MTASPSSLRSGVADAVAAVVDVDDGDVGVVVASFAVGA